MTTYDCSGCGEEFETLSSKRLHDCPAGARYGGDDPDAWQDVTGDDFDEMAEAAVEETLECFNCGVQSDGAADYDRAITDRGVSLTFKFECDECGAWNENTATFE